MAYRHGVDNTFDTAKGMPCLGFVAVYVLIPWATLGFL